MVNETGVCCRSGSGLARQYANDALRMQRRCRRRDGWRGQWHKGGSWRWMRMLSPSPMLFYPPPGPSAGDWTCHTTDWARRSTTQRTLFWRRLITLWLVPVHSFLILSFPYIHIHTHTHTSTRCYSVHAPRQPRSMSTCSAGIRRIPD